MVRDMVPNMKLTNCIKIYREELDLTQQQLSDIVGITKWSIDTIEKGYQNIPYVLACQIALALNRKVSEVFTIDF